jgi:para-nitrobenzyl esterase
MKPLFGKTLLAAAIILASALSARASGADRVRVSNGVIEGIGAQKSGVRSFKGIPFAQPPTGVLR